MQLAKSSDVAIVCVAVESGEGSDRENLSLPGKHTMCGGKKHAFTTICLSGDQDALVAAVSKAQSNTIVVIHGPGAVLMDAWISLVPSVVYAFYPGQEDGMVIFLVLFD